jgi:hypothetical protein
MNDTETLYSLFSLKAHAQDKYRPDPEILTLTTDTALALIEAVEAAREVCDRLDAAREWNYEQGRKDALKEIDFAIGATLSLRAPLDRFRRDG